MNSLPKLGKKRLLQELPVVVFACILGRVVVARILIRVIRSMERSIDFLALWGDPQGLHPKHRLTDYHDFFAKRVKPAWLVIDAGCGNGALASDVARKTGAHVIGIDISEENIRVAKRNFATAGVEFKCADILTTPMQKADAVLLSNVLEHIGDRVGFLASLRINIRPSVLLLRVPQYERHWLVPFGEELGEDMRLDSTHFVEHRLGSLVSELTSAGWVVRYCEAMWGEYRLEAVPAGGVSNE